MIEKLLGIIIVIMLIVVVISVFGLLVLLVGELMSWVKCPKELGGYRCKHRPGECGR